MTPAPGIRWAAAPPPAPVTRGGAAHAARDELSRQPYQNGRPGLVQRIASAIVERLQHGFDIAAHATPGGAAGFLLLVAVFAVGVVLLVVRLGPVRRRNLLDRSPGAGARTETAAELRRRAHELASAGDAAGSVRATTRAMVTELQQRGVLDPRPGTTMAALSHQAAAAVPAIGPDAADVSSLFDAIFFAGRPATPADAVRAAEAEARISRTRLRVAPPTPIGSASR